ncbi:hypothetical protein CDD80_747 [Ophiocordyceps camponoti-rufipedis]|uniref:Pentacotripeptide-repeat region of PRORP domain-containing protein n=1 Tax=Ophiocordyceps camponoti-rufipedis TaxID=2004952 RepID=A0A2C5Z8E3_9HYPO|nr:hypothetical protein CDD80_747 [Ophiocordyceps camponoti-rufipedis]
MLGETGDASQEADVGEGATRKTSEKGARKSSEPRAAEVVANDEEAANATDVKTRQATKTIVALDVIRSPSTALARLQTLALVEVKSPTAIAAGAETLESPERKEVVVGKVESCEADASDASVSKPQEAPAMVDEVEQLAADAPVPDTTETPSIGEAVIEDLEHPTANASAPETPDILARGEEFKKEVEHDVADAPVLKVPETPTIGEPVAEEVGHRPADAPIPVTPEAATIHPEKGVVEDVQSRSARASETQETSVKGESASLEIESGSAEASVSETAVGTVVVQEVKSRSVDAPIAEKPTEEVVQQVESPSADASVPEKAIAEVVVQEVKSRSADGPVTDTPKGEVVQQASVQEVESHSTDASGLETGAKGNLAVEKAVKDDTAEHVPLLASPIQALRIAERGADTGVGGSTISKTDAGPAGEPETLPTDDAAAGSAAPDSTIGLPASLTTSPEENAVERANAEPTAEVLQPDNGLLESGNASNALPASTDSPSESPVMPPDEAGQPADIAAPTAEQLQADRVLALIKAEDFSSAERTIKTELTQKRLAGGVEHLVAHFIRKRKWLELLKVWKDYSEYLGGKADVESYRWPQAEDVPDLGESYLLFEHYVETEGAAEAKTLKADVLLTLRRQLAELSLSQGCPPLFAAVILEIWKDENLYERYLLLMLDKWFQRQVTRNALTRLNDIYRNYRVLPKAKPSPALLHAMFRFCSNSKEDVNHFVADDIYRDWYKTWGGLDAEAFLGFLDLYGEAGDIVSVRKLWTRYTTRFPEALQVSRTFRSLVVAYAQRAEPEKAEREVRIMQETYGVQPDTEIWNAVLKGYMRMENAEVMRHCLSIIHATEGPNDSTYAIFMSLAAKRGDLDAATKIASQAQTSGIPVTAPMIRRLVTTYCQNDRLLAAERICQEASQRGLIDVEMWNQVLKFNGIKGKLDKCNELLRVMDDIGIEWDEHTYLQLLNSMIKVHKVLPAWSLLKKAVEERLFHVTDQHFEAVMNGASRAKFHDLVVSIASHMLQARPGPLSFNALAVLAASSLAKAPSAGRPREISQELLPALLELMPSDEVAKEKETEEQEDESKPPECRFGSMPLLRRKTSQIDRAVKVLVDLRDFKGAEQLINTYINIFPQFWDARTLPPKLAGAVMAGYLIEGKHNRALSIWDKAWKAGMARCRDSKGAVYPALRWHLTMPIHQVIHVLRDKEDPDGIVKVVEEALAVGFCLSRNTWNLVIWAMAKLGRWERAMGWCETMLMPGWRGWKNEVSPAKMRVLQADNHLLAPVKSTVFSLQEEWLKMRKLSAWSADVSNRIRQLERNHPLLHHAFITNDPAFLPAAWTIPRTPSFSRAIKDMLRSLTYRELKAIKTALIRQLHLLGLRYDPVAERARHYHRKRHQRKKKNVVESPFHVVVGGVGEDGHVQTKEFSAGELEVLDVELKKTMDKMRDSAAEASSSSSFSSADAPVGGPSSPVGGPSSATEETGSRES